MAAHNAAGKRLFRRSPECVQRSSDALTVGCPFFIEAEHAGGEKGFKIDQRPCAAIREFELKLDTFSAVPVVRKRSTRVIQLVSALHCATAR